MTWCVVGVDGGGSKTIARVTALDGTTLGEGTATGSNWESAGVDGAVAAIDSAVRTALTVAGRSAADVCSAAFGLAGVDWPSDRQLLDDALAALGLAGRRWVDNDVAIALRAGCTAGWGIVSNVGTGTVTAGRNRAGEQARTMAVGWGEPSGASGMVRDAIHAIAAAHHRTAPTTALTALVLDAAGMGDEPALFEALSRQRIRSNSAWAPLIGRAAADGDDVAQRLLVTGGERHGAMAVGTAERLGMCDDAFDLALSGSVHHARDRWFSPAFAATVAAGCPSATLALTNTPPVQGAVLIALDWIDVARGTGAGSDPRS